MTAELTIERLGAAGDGVAMADGRRVSVPLALPGERVRVQLPAGKDHAAVLLERLSDTRDRVMPPCPHFGYCGGCALQHLAPMAEVGWKEARIRGALLRQGVEAPPFLETFRAPENSRRRAELAFRRTGDSTVLGFHARSSRHVVDMAVCFVLSPTLLALLRPLRRFLTRLLMPGEAGDATLLASDTGIDLRLDFAAAPDLGRLESLSAFAESEDLARISWRVGGPRAGSGAERSYVPVAERRPVRVVFGAIAVDLPPGAFLQASIDAEAAMTEMVLDATIGCTRVLDLFCGVGTFTLPLAARGGRVHGVDGLATAVATLEAAIRHAQLANVTTELRDLAIRPWDAVSLARYDAILFDPPRLGAAAQAAEIAKSPAAVVVAISCNPSSFARDAALLIDGGLRLVALRTIDQFIWSAHTELVAIFRRS